MRSGYPQGEALTLALAKAEIAWASGRTGDGVKRERSPDAEAPYTKRQRNKARDGYQPATSFAQMAKGGKKFCVAWNKGKCSKHHKDCPRQELHFCNVQVNGKACFQRHRACDHSS